MTKYRKITEAELSNLVQVYANNKQITDKVRADLLKYIKENFVGGEKVVSIIAMVNSEYNDNGYDNSITSVLVFNADGNELTPKKGLHSSARKQLAGTLGNQIRLGGDYDCGTPEPLEDITINLQKCLPELYVKEE